MIKIFLVFKLRRILFRFVYLVLILLVVFLTACTEKKKFHASIKPNIIFFLVDDQRNETLGCYGHSIIQTPNIDKLAEEGTLFTNAFVTTPICAASRASILTGVTERTHGYTFGKPEKIIPASIARTNYPQLLRAAGYRTAFYGKLGCRLDADTSQMFDSFRAIGRNPYFHVMSDGSRRHETDICADYAIEFIESQSEDHPFCLSVSFNAPHAEDRDKRPGIGHFPWPPSVDGLYNDTPIPPPNIDTSFYATLPEFLSKSMNRKRYFWRWDTPQKYESNMRAYYRMISGIDHAIGRVLKSLTDNGLDDNTVIIYSADNGYYMGDRGFAGKWSHYEQSLRVPLIVSDPRLPDHKKNKVNSSLAINIDIPATILDLAGIQKPVIYQGESLMPIVKGAAEDNGRKDFLCEHLWDIDIIPKWEGVRTREYIYARYFGQDTEYEFLHDLNNDPLQLYNLVEEEAMVGVLNDLRLRCDSYIDSYSISME